MDDPRDPLTAGPNSGSPRMGRTWAPLTLAAGKRDLTLTQPWTNAAGMLGFSDEARRLVDLARLGAFITNPVSLQPRSPASGPRLVGFPGGFLLHTGHPNPGLSEVIRRHRRRWAELPCPVIVHLLLRTPEEAAQMAERLEPIEGVAALELGLETMAPEHVAATVDMASASQRPILVRLPLGSSWEAAQAAALAGAAAITLGPPRGALPAPTGGILRGRLYGPALFPLALQAVSLLARQVDCPVIGSGGLYSSEALQAMLAAGAAAVQLDTVLWTEPETVLGNPGDSLPSSGG